MINNFEIKIARYTFSCPICGTVVKPGQSYCEDLDGDAFCVCVLPTRKLIAVEITEKHGND
jgi:uncharacterized OB-fold protein